MTKPESFNIMALDACVVTTTRFRLDEDGRSPSRPMWASEMMEAIKKRSSAFFGEKLDEGMLRQVRAMARDLILNQIKIRGLQTVTFDLNWMTIEVDPYDHGSLLIATAPGYLEELDRDLRNRACDRCGCLLAFGFRHTVGECDQNLVQDVMSL